MQQPNLNALYNEFEKDPRQFLMKNHYTIPDSVDNNPQTIIQYLMSSGQLSQNQLMRVQNIIPQFQKLFNNRV